MVDLINRTLSNIGTALKGGVIKRGQLFKGVRELESDLQKIEDLNKDLDVAIKKGKKDRVLKDLKEDIDDMDDCKKRLLVCMQILLFDGHNLNTKIVELENKIKQLEHLNLEGAETYMVETKKIEAELKDGIANLAGMMGSEARSE